jgi:TATA-box binding protein (TBP) (component of TFIID and TFIIIB)
MSQKVKEFVKRSGIEVQTPNSVSTTASDDAFARNLEMNLLEKQEFPKNLKNNLVNNAKYGEFRQFINSNSNNNLDNEFNDVMKMLDNKSIQNLLAPTQLEVSKLNPGMFNATVNKDFGKQPRIDISKILMNKPIGRTFIGNNLYIDTEEIKGLYGQFKTGFSHTRAFGPKGGLNKNFFSAQLMLKISNDVETKGATVNFYKNGKIRFSGGFIGDNIVMQPELIRKYIVDTYTNKESFLYNPFEYNNLSGQFKINGIFTNLSNIASNSRKYGMTQVSYEPEITPFLYAYFGDTKFIITTSGNIQISGAKSPTDMLNAYNIGQRFVERLNADGQIRITGEFVESAKKTSKPKPQVKPKAKPKAKPGPKPKVMTKSKSPPSPLTNNQVNAQMIVGKQCERLKKPELMNFARKMGVVDFRTKVQNGTRDSTKREICDKIRAKMVVPSFKNKNTNVYLTGANKTFKIGNIICSNLKKDELIRIAMILKVPLSTSETKISLCKKIQLARNNLAAPKPKTPPPPPPTKKDVKKVQMNTKRAEIMKKRGLDDNSIRNDIIKLYGERWVKRYSPALNDDVRNMKKALSILNKGNKMGIPFKKDVDDIKKRVVGRWKFERKTDLEKKYLSNKINVSGINYKLRNAYRRAAVNYIMNQKGPVSNKKLSAYKKSWSKFMNTV